MLTVSRHQLVRHVVPVVSALAITGGGMTAIAAIGEHARPPAVPPAQAQGPLPPAARPHPSPGAASTPPPSVSPVLAQRISFATPAPVAPSSGSTAPAPAPSTSPAPSTTSPALSATSPAPAPAPPPVASPKRSPSCVVDVTIAHLEVCAGISVTGGSGGTSGR